MKKSKLKSNLVLFTLCSFIIFFPACTENAEPGSSKEQEVVMNIDSCYFHKVDSTTKCSDCESYLELFVTVNNSTDSEFIVRSKQTDKDANQYNSTFSIKAKELLVDGMVGSSSDSVKVNGNSKYQLVVQPDISRIRFPSMSYQRYDSYLLDFVNTGTMYYESKGIKMPVAKSESFKIVQKTDYL